MRLRKSYLILSILFYTLLVFGYSVWFNFRSERELIRHIDEKLLAAAMSLKYMLLPDFHDRAVSADSIAWEEIERNRKAISSFAFESEFEYIYTLVEKDGSYYFSAPTVTPEEYAERKSWYFYPYEDVPPIFREALEENKTLYTTYTDQWGTFRSIALPQESPGGNRYLSCADYDVSYVSDEIFHNYTTSVLTALFFMLLTIPFILAYRKNIISHNTELRSMNRELRDYRNQLETLVEKRTEALKQAKTKAEEASRLKSRLLFNVSHELRTPLNGIIGYCEALSDTGEIDLAHHYGNIIQRESDILLALINDWLDMAKIEAGKMNISPVPFNIRDFVVDTIRGQAVIAEKKHLQFNLSIAEAVPQILKGDSLRIRQVLLNLVSNAVKFTEAGSVDISLGIKEKDTETITLAFTVQDTGLGIPQDKLAVIFDSFSQADPTITRRFGGTGLGVSIASQLVDLMGGTIDVESEPGKGSIFSFTLPLKMCRKEEEISVRLNSENSDIDQRNLSGSGNILLVDDYPTTLEILSLFLERAGYTITKSENGTDAIEYCRTGSFDCIFMDIQMPDIDGFETARRIHFSNSPNAATPIIGLSASIDESTRDRCNESGMSGFLLKPVKKARLLSLAAYWTSRNRTSENSLHYAFLNPDLQNARPKVFDFEKALVNFEQDRELFISALNRFSELVESGKNAMELQFTKGDMDSLFREAHKIKGAAGLLGADELFMLAAKLEEAGRKSRAEGVHSLMQDFFRAAERFSIMAKNFRKEAIS